MTRRIWRYMAVVVVALLGASVVSAAPSAADEGGSLRGVDPGSGMDVNSGFSGSPSSVNVPRGDVNSDTADATSGSLGVVNEAVAYKVLWSGGAVPSGVAALAEVSTPRPGLSVMESFSVAADDDGPAFKVPGVEGPDAGSHQLVTVAADDSSLYQLLVVVEDANAPNEYRFDGAVPAGHTAELLSDGSVAFYDSDGAEAGGIAAPWALDANGSEVATAYSLDNNTLVQTISHEGAAYPVIADPDWREFKRQIVVVTAGAATALLCYYITKGRMATAICGGITAYVTDWVSRNYRPRTPEQDRNKGCRNPRQCFA